MNRIATTAGLALAFTFTACVGGPTADPFGEAPSTSSDPNAISVVARNDNAEDVVLYLMSASGIQEVGMLGPETGGVFRVRWEEPRELRVRVEIVAGPRYTTNALARVIPGDMIEVRVRSDVRRSIVRRR